MDEIELKMGEYRFKKIVAICFWILLIIDIFHAPFMFIDRKYILFLIEIMSALILLWGAFNIPTVKITISDNSIIQSEKFPSRTYELKFDEIGIISDDTATVIIPWIKVFVFHLIPKEGIKKNFKRFTVTQGFERPLEILSEVISKVDKDTQIDASLLERLEKYKQKL